MSWSSPVRKGWVISGVTWGAQRVCAPHGIRTVRICYPDEAFAHTQAYAIENGIGLTKKRTNYLEKGGPVRHQDLCCDRRSYQANRVAYQPVKENRKRQRGSAQTACEYTVRIHCQRIYGQRI